jgi:DNA-binding MarR family transcriptional regulator
MQTQQQQVLSAIWNIMKDQPEGRAPAATVHEVAAKTGLERDDLYSALEELYNDGCFVSVSRTQGDIAVVLGLTQSGKQRLGPS